MGCSNWHTTMHKDVWIYCPGHARVSGNEWAEKLASTADIASGLKLGRAEVLRGLRSFLNMTGQCITVLIIWREKEWRKETPGIPSSEIRTMCLTKDWHCFKSNLGAEHIWVFLSTTMPFWTETETVLRLSKSTSMQCEVCVDISTCNNREQK